MKSLLVCTPQVLSSHLTLRKIAGKVFGNFLTVKWQFSGGSGSHILFFYFNMLISWLLECNLICLSDRLGNEEEDKVSVVSDLESIVTFYSKSRGLDYVPGNGWLGVLQVRTLFLYLWFITQSKMAKSSTYMSWTP